MFAPASSNLLKFYLQQLSKPVGLSREEQIPQLRQALCGPQRYDPLGPFSPPRHWKLLDGWEEGQRQVPSGIRSVTQMWFYWKPTKEHLDLARQAFLVIPHVKAELVQTFCMVVWPQAWMIYRVQRNQGTRERLLLSGQKRRWWAANGGGQQKVIPLLREGAPTS